MTQLMRLIDGLGRVLDVSRREPGRKVSMMQTITLKARTDQNGVATIAIPTDLADQEIEIVLVFQQSAAPSAQVDSFGYPIGYFGQTYGSFANDPLERDQPLTADARDELE